MRQVVAQDRVHWDEKKIRLVKWHGADKDQMQQERIRWLRKDRKAWNELGGMIGRDDIEGYVTLACMFCLPNRGPQGT